MNLLHISLPSRYPATPARSDRRRQSRRQRPELLGLEQRNLLSIAVAHGIEAVPLDRGAIVVVGGHDHASGVTDDRGRGRGNDDNPTGGSASSSNPNPESGDDHGSDGNGNSSSGSSEPEPGRGGDDSGSGQKNSGSHSGKSPAHSGGHHKPQRHHEPVERPIAVHV
jgi:hypothetical protein